MSKTDIIQEIDAEIARLEQVKSLLNDNITDYSSKWREAFVVCDCHHVPMQYEAMVVLPSGKTVMCCISDCGRNYSRLLGYFHLHATETGNYMDSNTRVSRAREGETCAGRRFMGLVYDPGPAGQTGTYWYCFKCGHMESETTESRSMVGGYPKKRGPEIISGQSCRTTCLETC